MERIMAYIKRSILRRNILHKLSQGINRISAKGVFIGIILTVFTVIQVYPLIFLVFFSLKNNDEIFSGNAMGPPNNVVWNNYARALMGGNVAKYFMNSLIIAIFTIIIVAILSSMASYALTRMRWKLSKTVMTTFTMGLMIPVHVALLPLFIILGRIKLMNTHWALILPYAAFGLPIAILILSSFMQTIPVEIEECACLDGCSIYMIFFRIIVPLIKSGLVTVVIFTFLSAWNELMFAITFANSKSVRPLTAGITSLVGEYFSEWGPIGAGLVIATLPTIIMYLFMSNEVQKSLIAGAIKG